jgi:hypothetical protein
MDHAVSPFGAMRCGAVRRGAAHEHHGIRQPNAGSCEQRHVYLLLMVGGAPQEGRAPAMARLRRGLAPAPHARRMAR